MPHIQHNFDRDTLINMLCKHIYIQGNNVFYNRYSVRSIIQKYYNHGKVYYFKNHPVIIFEYDDKSCIKIIWNENNSTNNVIIFSNIKEALVGIV